MEVKKAAYRVKATVVSVKGTCPSGHKVGDEIIFDDSEVRGRICFDALASMIPKVYGLRYNASFPWLKDPDQPARHACPDAANVVFALERLPGNLRGE